MNRWVLEQGVESGEVKIDNDLCFYGRYCRNLLAFLTYSDDPYIPLISYHEDRAQKLLDNLGIATKTQYSKLETDRWRVYADLTEEEKRKLISELANILINCRMVKKVDELIGESYVFPKHEKNETYEANEFSTLLNACGRHKRSDIGLRVCLGDSTAFDEARTLLSMHRKMIREGISFAQNNIQDLGGFYLIDARNIIDESIIGTVIGMVQRATWTKPILGVSVGEGETIKFSSRANRALVESGLNLAKLMNAGCVSAGGIGGGHKIAAGASIPNNKINEFLLAVGHELGQST
jgi:RecJ-like exonuclease